MSTHRPRRAVILTALQLEFSAVVEHLRNRREEPHPQGTIYERGTFDERSQPWDVLVAEVGAGNEGAAAEAERAIQHFDPDVAVFVGVAGGIKDVKLGDVVASAKVYNYGYGKAKEEFEPRPAVALPSYRLEQRARAVARREDWKQRINGGGPNDPSPSAVVQPIAAGPVVVASGRASLFAFIRKQYGDAVAVEMEGHGHLVAVRLNAPVEGIVIRGISDLVEGKDPDADVEWQPVAARHAAAFTFEVLSRLDVPARDAAGDRRAATVNQHVVAVQGSGNVIVSTQTVGVDPALLVAALRVQESQQATIGELAGSLGGLVRQESQPTLSRQAALSLIVQEAERMLASLKDQLELLEYPAAAESVRRLKAWMQTHEQHLSSDLAADVWVTVADAIAQQARRDAGGRGTPDLTEAEAYLEKARHEVGA